MLQVVKIDNNKPMPLTGIFIIKLPINIIIVVIKVK